MMRKLFIMLSILFISTAGYAQTYTVKAILNGETLLLNNGEIVALIGVKIPKVTTKEETFWDRTTSDEPSKESIEDAKAFGVELMDLAKMGQEATEFVKSLITPCGKQIELEFDVQERDKYGRLLAYAYCPNIYDDGPPYPSSNPIYSWERGFLFYNATIIRAGYAQPMTIPPNVKYAELFEKLYQEAREQKRGLWKEQEDSVVEDGTPWLFKTNYKIRPETTIRTMNAEWGLVPIEGE